MSERIKLIAIVGPTAVGKTELAIRLAERFGGEIIGADSRQIYRLLDIGTAKPTPAERARVPHHLIDLVMPDETLTLGKFKELVTEAIADITRRGHLPFLVGGTGLYLKTVLEGWTIPEVAPNPALRESLMTVAQREGNEALHRQLAAVDPAAASKVDPRNVRRVVRYLEVYHETGGPVSAQQRKEPPAYDILKIGITRPRAQLYRRIGERVDAMVAAGLVDEVKRVLALGYDSDLPALSGFGYRQIIQYLHGEYTLEKAIEETKKLTRRFVHRQYAWFSLDDSTILWFNAESDIFDQASTAIQAFLDGA